MDDPTASETVRLVNNHSKSRMRLYVAVGSVYLVNLTYGAALSYSSPALPDIRKRMSLSDSENDWFGSFVSIGATLGALAGGLVVTYVGRKESILISSLGFVFGFLFIEIVPVTGVMFAGRALTGFSMGLEAMSTPAFIAEISPPEIRGLLVGLSVVFASLGIVLAYALGKWLDYQSLAVACMIPSVLVVMIVPWLAESPRWLLQAGRREEAREAFRFYGAEDEGFQALTVSMRNRGMMSLRDIRHPRIYMPLVHVVVAQTLQPFSGIIVLLSYAHDIFQTSGSSIVAADAAILIGAVRVPCVLIASFLIDRFGRKPLMLISLLSVIFNLVIVGVFYYMKETQGPSFVTAYNWLPLAALSVFTVGYCLGIGPLPWILMSEMLPLHIRGSGTAIATAFHFASAAVTAKEYHPMINLLGNHGIYWFFAGVMALWFLFVLFFLPETKGKSLEEIEALFERNRKEIMTGSDERAISNCSGPSVGSEC